MKTDDFIAALAADTPTLERSLGRRLSLALASGALVSLAFFMTMLGPRQRYRRRRCIRCAST